MRSGGSRWGAGVGVGDEDDKRADHAISGFFSLLLFALLLTSCIWSFIRPCLLGVLTPPQSEKNPSNWGRNENLSIMICDPAKKKIDLGIFDTSDSSNY